MEGRHLMKIDEQNWPPEFLNIIQTVNKLIDLINFNNYNNNWNNTTEIDLLAESIIAFGNYNFDHRIPITEKFTLLDAIAVGVNMLGDELSKTNVSRDFFNNVFDSVSDAVLVFDNHVKLSDINKAAKTLFKTGFESKQLVSIHNNDFNNLIEKLHDFVKSGLVEASFIYKFSLEDNSEKIFLITISRVIDKSNIQKGYLMVMRDHTIQHDKELNDLKIIIQTQEKERARLALDIHDSLGQEITAIKLLINTLDDIKGDEKLFAETLNSSKNIVNNVIHDIRNLTFDLLPKSLEYGGLNFALNELSARLKSVIDIELKLPKEEINFEKSVSLSVFRIIQEFISNSLKHSCATKISIKVAKESNYTLFYLSDNGSGFNMEEFKNGNGVYNIKLRLKALNSEFVYESKLNKGTKLIFKIN